jgi:hypothetical protein
MRNSIRRSGGKFAFLGLERGLDFDRALDRIDDAGELGEYTVARGVDEASVMLLDERVDQPAMRGQSAVSRLLVLPHEAAIAEDVGAEYGGELTFHARVHFGTEITSNPLCADPR